MPHKKKSGLYDFIYIKFQNANLSMVTESRHSCLWLRGQKKKKRGITKEQEKQLGEIIMPIILMEVTASEVYTYVRFQISSLSFTSHIGLGAHPMAAWHYLNLTNYI